MHLVIPNDFFFRSLLFIILIVNQIVLFACVMFFYSILKIYKCSLFIFYVKLNYIYRKFKTQFLLFLYWNRTNFIICM